VAPAPQGVENGNGNATGNGPADKITICHATHSETNPFVVITISENGLSGHGRPGHQDDEDVIPARADGSCLAAAGPEPPPREPPTDGNPPPDGPDDVPAGEPGRDRGAVPSAGADEGLPFTGIAVGFLALAGAMALAGGAALRRAAGDEALVPSEPSDLSRRCAAVSRQTSDWSDSVAARTTALGERIAELERSLAD
jgi:hypothetical protein